MPIINQPIKVGVFDKMWISSVVIQTKRDGFLRIVFNPYDGKNVLATNTKIKNFTNLNHALQSDQEFNSMLQDLYNECKRQAGINKKIESISFSALNPDSSASAVIVFEKEQGEERGQRHQIKNCFALAESDSQFGNVFQTAMVMFAMKSGFTYQ